MRGGRQYSCILLSDQTDHGWTVGKLDALLTDPEVQSRAADALSAGFRGGGFDPEPVYRRCRDRYRRKEPATLLFLLAARLFERLPPGAGKAMEAARDR